IAFWGSLHPTGRELLHAVALNPWQMLLEIVLIIGLPFAVGLLLRAWKPAFSQRVQPFVRWFSLIALVAFIIGALAGNWAVFVSVIGTVLIVVAVHDAVALGIGYTTAVVGRLGTRERKAMTFEVGIRNAGLGLGVIFAFFGGLGGMAVVAGWWGIWDIIAGLTVATLWAGRTRRRTGSIQGDASPHAITGGATDAPAEDAL